MEDELVELVKKLMGENIKACCTCRHCITEKVEGLCYCYCDTDFHLMGYSKLMGGWCKNWAEEDE